MQIEAGKYYKTRDGRKVGPAKVAGAGKGKHKDWNWMLGTESGDAYYQDHGTAPYMSELDIIAEWTDTQPSPVRTETITRSVIVPGVYGRVHVGLYEGKPAVWTDDRTCACIAPWTADELDAAALVLTQLAAAVRDAD